MMKRIAFRCATLAACGSLVSCGPGKEAVTAAGAAGECTVSEPGGARFGGVAAYVEHVTPTTGNRFGLGSLGVTIVCTTGGTAPDQVTIVLPNLVRGEGAAEGEYRVRHPADSLLSEPEMTDPRLAWARVRRGSGMPLLYTADGGRVTIVRSRAGLLEGAFQVAFAAADTPVSLPGARAEAGEGAVMDAAGERIRSPSVLGGAFVAPRKEADWRGN